MRTARQNIPGVIYHVISVFVDNSWYFRDDVDRSMYLRALGNALKRSDWLCFAYALMSSHIHLGLVAGAMPLESWARSVNSTVGRALNHRYDRRGPVFAERPADFAVPARRELDLVAYIHNNPVRAHVVECASDSTWTSHRAFMGTAPCPEWLHARESLARMNLDRAKFGASVDAMPTMTDVDLDELRRALRDRGAVNLATPTVGSRLHVPLVSRPFATVRPDPRVVVRVVADSLRVTVGAITSRQRSGPLSRARRIAVHCVRAAGFSTSDAAAVLGISRQRASTISLTELDEAERAVHDHVLARLEVELT